VDSKTCQKTSADQAIAIRSHDRYPPLIDQT